MSFSSRTGVLLVNLGTPDAPDTASVRRYLKEFLWDPRVVEVSRPIWWLVLNLIILNTRPKKSAAAYAKVWTDQGSPLLVYSKKQRDKLASAMGDKVEVFLAMRYGEPSITGVLDEIAARGIDKLVILPLYPQYSATTTASIFDAVSGHFQKRRDLPEMRFVRAYCDNSEYIGSLAASIREYWQEHGQAQVLLLSFHGIPKDYCGGGDPYAKECGQTASALALALGVSKSLFKVSFQSRLGPRKWLTPYTDETLEQLAKDGVRSVQVVCPGFSADCLETLEEIAMENRDVFLENGGESYQYIPCLNDRDDHIQMMVSLVREAGNF